MSLQYIIYSHLSKFSVRDQKETDTIALRSEHTFS